MPLQIVHLTLMAECAGRELVAVISSMKHSTYAAAGSVDVEIVLSCARRVDWITMVHVQVAEGRQQTRCACGFLILDFWGGRAWETRTAFEMPRTELTAHHPRAFHPTRGKAPSRRPREHCAALQSAFGGLWERTVMRIVRFSHSTEKLRF